MTYKYLHLWDCKCALLVNRACFYIDFTLQVGEPLMGSTNKLSAIHLLMHKDKGHPYITSAKGWMSSECKHFCWCSVQHLCWHSGWVGQKKSWKCADVVHEWSLSNLSDLPQQINDWGPISLFFADDFIALSLLLDISFQWIVKCALAINMKYDLGNNALRNCLARLMTTLTQWSNYHLPTYVHQKRRKKSLVITNIFFLCYLFNHLKLLRLRGYFLNS